MMNKNPAQSRWVIYCALPKNKKKRNDSEEGKLLRHSL